MQKRSGQNFIRKAQEQNLSSSSQSGSKQGQVVNMGVTNLATVAQPHQHQHQPQQQPTKQSLSALHQQLAARQQHQQQSNHKHSFKFADSDTPDNNTPSTSKKDSATQKQHLDQRKASSQFNPNHLVQQSVVNARRPPKASLSRSPHRGLAPTFTSNSASSHHKEIPYQMNPNLARSMYTVSQHLENAPIFTASQQDEQRHKSHRQRGGKGPQYQQMSTSRVQPDRRTGLHETPAIGEIDDLAINIMDLQAPGGVVSMTQGGRDGGARDFRRNEDLRITGPNDNKTRNPVGGSNHHLQLDFDHNMLHLQQVALQSSSMPSSVSEANKNSRATTSAKEKFLPLSPKISTKADVENKLVQLNTGNLPNDQSSSQNQHQQAWQHQVQLSQVQLSQQQRQQMASSIDKKELQIAMPNNSTVTLLQQHHHLMSSSQATPENHSNRVVHTTLGASSGGHPPYQGAPSQLQSQPKRKRAKDESATTKGIKSGHQAATAAAMYLTRPSGEVVKTGTMAQNQMAMHHQSKNTLGRQQTANAMEDINSRAGSNSNNMSLSWNNSANRNVIQRALTAGQVNSRKMTSTSTVNGGGQGSSSKSIARKPQPLSGAALGDLEKRLTSKFEMQFQAQEQRFMTILEKVIESNEVVKDQLQRQILGLQSQVELLQTEVDQQKAHDMGGGGPPEVAWQTEHTEIRSGEQYLLSEEIEYQAQPHEVDHNHGGDILENNHHHHQASHSKLAARPNGAHDLIVDDRQPDNDHNNYLMGDEMPYSPISQLDGIDFSKVLSTKSNKTFINELNGQKPKTDEDANISPMPKLNLSVLSDPQQIKSMTRREQELLQRVSKLKKDDASGQKRALNEEDSNNSEDQLDAANQSTNSEPKFIGHIARQTSSISRNNINVYSAPHGNHGYQNDQSQGTTAAGAAAVSGGLIKWNETAPNIAMRANNTLLPQVGEMTGRSENVQDTHRSSMADARHNEQHSLKPVSREPTNEDCSASYIDSSKNHMNTASNEQKAMLLKYQSIRNKRTNSLHQSRDASFLSTYNASLVGMNTSMHCNTNNSSRHHQKQAASQTMKENYREEDVNREGKLQSSQQNIVSPLSRSGFDYFSQNKVVSLLNQQKGGGGDVAIDDDDPTEAIKDEGGIDSKARVGPNKTKSRSASYHFSMNNGDGSDIASLHRRNAGGASGGGDIGSPNQSVTKNSRKTNTSVVQNNRRVNELQDTVVCPGKSSGRGALHALDLKERATGQVPERCVCQKPQIASNTLFVNGALRNNQTARVRNEEQSVPSTPLREGVMSVDRLSSANIIRDLPNSNSQVSIAKTDTEAALETIADEDVPLKAFHHAHESEVKLTEVDRNISAIPDAFRSINLNKSSMTTLQGMLNIQPCGEYCQWLSAEAQRDIIRGILTSTQGNTTLKASQGRPGEKRFLVNAVWWRKWTDYVNFDLVESEPPSSQQEHLRQERKKSRSASRHNSAKKNNNTSFYAGGLPSADSSMVDNSAATNYGTTTSGDGAAKKLNFMNELMSLKKSKSITRKTPSQQTPTAASSQTLRTAAATQLTKATNPVTATLKQPPVVESSQSNQSEQEQPSSSSQAQPNATYNGGGTTVNTSVEEEEFNEGGPNEEMTLARIVPSIKNSGVTMRTSTNLNLYARPGAVENHDLLQQRNCLLVKNNLIEHHDYVALPSDIWKHIYQWYSTDWSIVRFLRKDATQGVILDLNPGHDVAHRVETTQMDTDGEGANADGDNNKAAAASQFF